METALLQPTSGSSYLATVGELLARLPDQWEAISGAAQLVATALASGSQLLSFGTGHSSLLAQELFYRAGGLVALRPILFDGLLLHPDAELSTQIERLPGLARTLLDNHQVAAGDVVFVFSNSGRNQVVTEFAAEARARGAKVIAVTSLQHSAATTPRGQGHLSDHADVVIDNLGVPGDAAIAIPGVPQRVGPTSTVLGAAIANAIVVEAIALSAARGVLPRIHLSANVDVLSAASVAITDETGRLLLGRRGHDPERGRWSLPGGKARAGESVEEAAVREAFEETGLRVRLLRPLPVETKDPGDGRVYLIHCFVAEVIDGHPRPGDDADELRWVAPEELDEIPLTTNLLDYLGRAGLARHRCSP